MSAVLDPSASPAASEPESDELGALIGACELEAYPGEMMERRIANGDFAAEGKQLVVVNPRGTPPPIRLRPMAARPRSLEGRTVYFVDVRFMNGKSFLAEI